MRRIGSRQCLTDQNHTRQQSNTRVGHIQFNSANSRKPLKEFYILDYVEKQRVLFVSLQLDRLHETNTDAGRKQKCYGERHTREQLLTPSRRQIQKKMGSGKKQKTFWKNLGSTTIPWDYVVPKRLILNELLHSEVGTTFSTITKQTAVSAAHSDFAESCDGIECKNYLIFHAQCSL